MRQETEPRLNGMDEYVTIIARSMAEVMRQFRTQGLAEKNYAIVHRVGRHRFTVADDLGPVSRFDGETMVAATFARRSLA